MSQLIKPRRVISESYRCEYLLVGQPDTYYSWYPGRYEGPDRDEAVDEARTRWRSPQVLGVRVVEFRTSIAEERVKTK